MLIETVPLTGFVHGHIVAREGHPLMMNESTAQELERHGLVRIKLAPGDIGAGKAADDGAGTPSSASPAAPASPPPMLQPSMPGVVRRRRPAT